MQMIWRLIACYMGVISDLCRNCLRGQASNLYNQQMSVSVKTCPGNSCPLHIHTTQDEFIFVLESQLELKLDGQWHTAKTGDLVRKLAPQRGQSRGSKFRATLAKAVDPNLRYLERDGVTKDGEKGRVYSAIEDEADGKAFVERGGEDRHQFRFIVAPEDAVDIADILVAASLMAAR